MSERITVKQFRTALKAEAWKLAEGEIKKLEVTKAWLWQNIDGEIPHPQNYIRNAIAAYRPIKHRNLTVSVKTRDEKIDGIDHTIYSVHLKPVGERAKSEMQVSFDASYAMRITAALMKAQPDLSHLTGKEHSGAIQGAELMRQALADALTNQGGE